MNVIASKLFNGGRPAKTLMIARRQGFEHSSPRRAANWLAGKILAMPREQVMAALLTPEPVSRRVPNPPSQPKALKPSPVNVAMTPAARMAERQAFYYSDAWRAIRYQAICLYGRVCMCCGAKDRPIHVDHIVPRSIDANLSLVFDNLQILCEDCNLGKRNTDTIDYRTDDQKALARFRF